MAFQVKIHQIRAFVEVARQGSIRGASRMLNMSQPALSKSIQELEEGLAAQLFFRRSKGVTLTDAGESFYQHASLILEELRAAQEEIRQRQGQLAVHRARDGGHAAGGKPAFPPWRGQADDCAVQKPLQAAHARAQLLFWRGAGDAHPPAL